MSETNGSYVSRAELTAHIKGIDDHFDVVEAAILRIESKLNAKSAFWANAWVLLVTAALGAAIGTGVWFVFAAP